MAYRSLYIYGALLLLTACGGSYPEFEGDSRYYDSDTPKTEKQKVGRPYQIKGRWYKPEIDNGYEEVGIASWYGPGFHGRPTANGERFDENKVSAAHTTLPLPSYVEVTNLDNGKQLYVRVNDRGPFADDRIIDLSKRAAELLGMKQAGVARVRVKLTDPPKNITLLAPDGSKRKGKPYTPSSQPVMLAQNSPKNMPRENKPLSQKGLALYETPKAKQPSKPLQLSAYTPSVNDNTDEINALIQSYETTASIPQEQYKIKVGVFENKQNVAALLENNIANLGQLRISSIEREGKILSEVSLEGYKSPQEVLNTVDALHKFGITDPVILKKISK